MHYEVNSTNEIRGKRSLFILTQWRRQSPGWPRRTGPPKRKE